MDGDRDARRHHEGTLLHGAEPGGRRAKHPAGAAGAGRTRRLVVRDVHEIETAAFWYDAPEVRDGERRPQDIGTEVFFLPAVGPEKEGTFTNTQRLIQWHDKAVDRPADARSEAGFMVELGRRLKELYAGDDSPRGRQLAALTWDYPTDDQGEPNVEGVLKEINGYTVADWQASRQLQCAQGRRFDRVGVLDLCGDHPCGGADRSRARQADARASLGWGFTWPNNVHLLYNRAAADPDGKPWSERKAWVWWDADAGRWTGHDVADFPPTKAPDYRPPVGRRAPTPTPATPRSCCSPMASARS